MSERVYTLIDAGLMIARGEKVMRVLSKRGALEILSFLCLSLKAIRFKEFEEMLPRISTRIIAARLKELTELGIIERVVHKEFPPRVEYSLTKKGEELTSVFISLAGWILKWAP